jgi:hypothetical protein
MVSRSALRQLWHLRLCVSAWVMRERGRQCALRQTSEQYRASVRRVANEREQWMQRRLFMAGKA